MILEQTLIIHGKVQGVGYRQSVIRFLDNEYIDLKGFVTNMPNGTVKIVAQGKKEDIARLRNFASKGPEKAKVKQIEESLREIRQFSYESFEIQY
ncbi:MAG: acylphosphatase [Bacteriovoracaceae bacterium]|nr:acylphosphatase [Bacteriovoracaceae bacterium]